MQFTVNEVKSNTVTNVVSPPPPPSESKSDVVQLPEIEEDETAQNIKNEFEVEDINIEPQPEPEPEIKECHSGIFGKRVQKGPVMSAGTIVAPKRAPQSNAVKYGLFALMGFGLLASVVGK